MKKWALSTLMFAAVVALAATIQPGAGLASVPSVLRVAFLPGENPAQLGERHGSLLAYLTRELGIQCDLVAVESYEEMLELMHARKIDLGFFGGLTFLRARARDGVVPVVIRDIDLQFTSAFIVPAKSTATKLTDLRGRSIMFGSRLSTSGHLMPRHFLQEQDIIPEVFFSEVAYSGSHDKTAYAVQNGEAQMGALASATLERMFADGRLERDQVRVLWETPPYVDCVWAASPDLNTKLRERIRDAFLALSPESAAHQRVLRDQHASYFVPVSTQYFRVLGDIAQSAGLLEASP